MRTVGDLRKYLEKQSISPEKASKIIHVSNMTIRRLLKMDPKSHLPKKYELHFAYLVKAQSKKVK